MLAAIGSILAQLALLRGLAGVPAIGESIVYVWGELDGGLCGFVEKDDKAVSCVGFPVGFACLPRKLERGDSCGVVPCRRVVE